MLNDGIVPFNRILIGTEGTKLEFKCSMGVLKKILRTLQAILCQIMWTDFRGQTEPTYLLKG